MRMPWQKANTEAEEADVEDEELPTGTPKDEPLYTTSSFVFEHEVPVGVSNGKIIYQVGRETLVYNDEMPRATYPE